MPHGDAMGLIDMTIDAVHQRLVPVYDWLADATVYGAQRVALYRPTSFHGALSCQGRGACADKTLEACDDGKPCTADDCSPLAGCIHTPKGVGLCPSSSGCSKHGSCDAGTCTEPEYGRVFVHSLADLVDAPQKIEGRVTRTPDPELGHAWTWTVVGGDLLLQGWELSLSTGTANEGGPPTIRCTGLTGVADIRRRPNGEIIAYGPYTDSKYAHGAALCIAAVGWQPATAKTPIFDGAVVKVVNGTASSIHEPRGISLHTNGDLLAVWNSSKQGGTMFMRRFDVNLKQLFNSDYDSSLVVAVKAVVSGAYGDSYAVGRLGDEGPSQFPFLLRRASASDAKEQVDLKELAGGAFLDAAVAGKDIIAVGTTIHTAAARSTLATRIDTDNKLIWIHGPAIPDQGELAGVVAVEDGYVAVGTRIVGGPRNLMAVRRTEAGQTLWQRTHAYDNGIDVEATVSSLVRTEAGGFLFGAKRVAEGTPLWVHISAHGYFTCDGAGACASPTQACDDKDPCTADYCDAAAGCKHAAITGCKAP